MRGCWAMDPIRKEAPMAAADRSTADPRTRFPLALKLGLALAAVAVATGVLLLVWTGPYVSTTFAQRSAVLRR